MSDDLLYAKRLLSLLAAAGRLSVEGEQVRLGESLQPWFQGEKVVSLPANTIRAYFWQRLFRVAAETEPALYRLGVPEASWPAEIADFRPPVWVFWAMAQFTAPRLMEEAITFVIDETKVQRVEPGFMMNSLSGLAPAKIQVTPEIGAQVMQRVRLAAEDLLKPRMDQVRAEMERTLHAELERIRLYYESILKNRTLSEETRFLLQERDHLVREHYRRLAPKNLRVTVRVEFGALLVPLAS